MHYIQSSSPPAVPGGGAGGSPNGPGGVPVLGPEVGNPCLRAFPYAEGLNQDVRAHGKYVTYSPTTSVTEGTWHLLNHHNLDLLLQEFFCLTADLL